LKSLRVKSLHKIIGLNCSLIFALKISNPRLEEEMDIIKESAGCVNVLRTTGWVYSLAYFLSLFEEAKKDFPKAFTCPAGYTSIVALENKR
jgi:hypothetical protein